MLRYFIVHKPFQVLSQFSPVENKNTLKDIFDVPADVYPVGRLDYDSEGLLILTNDGTMNKRLLHPTYAHEREYRVQVDGAISAMAIYQLSKGVTINVDGKNYQTKPSQAIAFENEPAVSERNPPVRFRKNIPTSWIQLILTEGKNRQVRKMTAAVGFPTLRLIRYRIEKLTIGSLESGQLQELSQAEINSALFRK
ncbi:MAG: pseudouridine synthase [Chitinophagaceae bacterium]